MGIAEEIWIIDDGPLDIMAAEIPLDRVSGWPLGVFYVAEATAAASKEPGSRRRALLDVKTDGVRVFSHFDVFAGSEAWDALYCHLRVDQSTSVNLAEHQAIAWGIVEERRAVFVTSDRVATTLSLAELGRSRVCHPFEFWKELEQAGLIANPAWTALCGRLLRAEQRMPGIPWRYRVGA